MRETARLVEKDGGAAVDLRDIATIDAALREVQSRLGPLKGLVNYAATFPSGPFLGTDAGEYDDAVAVHPRSHFFAAQSKGAAAALTGPGHRAWPLRDPRELRGSGRLPDPGRRRARGPRGVHATHPRVAVAEAARPLTAAG